MEGSLLVYVCFFKQKTAYEMRISDWSSDVCSSDLRRRKLSKYQSPAGDTPASGLSFCSPHRTVPERSARRYFPFRDRANLHTLERGCSPRPGSVPGNEWLTPRKTHPLPVPDNQHRSGKHLPTAL